MIQNLKSLHIDDQRIWRGGEQQVLYLVKGLKEKGLETEVVCQPQSPLAQRAQEAGIKTHPVRMRGEADLWAVVKIREILKKGGHGIVHMHTAHAHTLGCLASMGLKGVHRVVARRVDFSTRKGLLSPFKYNHLGVDRYIAISEAVKEVLIRDGVKADKIEVVHSGIDPDRLKGADGTHLYKEFGLDPSNSIIIGNVAALVGHKGQEYLIRAMIEVMERFPQVRLFIVGNGELERPLKALARELGLEERVFFTGFREDVASFLDFFHIYVMSSHLEGLGTSLLDAMAVAKPIVATRAGGIKEVMENGVEGLLVEAKNPAALSRAIIHLIENPQEAQAMAQRAKERLLRDFTAQRMMEGTLRVYHGLMKGGF